LLVGPAGFDGQPRADGYRQGRHQKGMFNVHKAPGFTGMRG
jgi:hypothetical protein